ncbi:hypothetical protein ACWA5Z_10185 [Testudinibacter sp. P80/BLE/0925]|uniref:hypothetical protein n=1 Tax=Testudinibacter sp. TW-1 TaxID=3417757 RepID=UPI003D36E677
MIQNDLDLPVDDYLIKYTNPNEQICLIGYFPATNHILVEGEIWLSRGAHLHKYGLDHIWQGRRTALIRLKIVTVREVINHLISILNRRTPIYPEIKDTKTAVVKTTSGAVIIEKIEDGNEHSFYSAVTLLTATRAAPLNVQGRWGNKPLNHIKKDCQKI